MNSFDVFDQFLRQMICLTVYMLFIGRCYALADVIAIYCGRSVFRDGLLTLIFRALMVLMRFWSSLPTILKLSRLIL